ncbi:MAG: transcriptional regulator, partial [Gorillibacterium sp.]|nr:transcriptional regulator [Gorillibacterium sp.]
AQTPTRELHLIEIPVGHYTDFHIEPTCGLATVEKVIGTFDEPRCFLDPKRVDAKILWLGKGFVEYKVPNFLLKGEIPIELEISLELSSEAPFTNDNWPSDITFSLNGIDLGVWTSPGDFGGSRGKYTPDWWMSDINQYGLLKMLKINSNGTFIDGEKLSNVTIDQLDVQNRQWSFRISVLDDAVNVGGLTLFGAGFGNYNQDILFKLYYSRR